jgi:hypothetical protein
MGEGFSPKDRPGPRLIKGGKDTASVEVVSTLPVPTEEEIRRFYSLPEVTEEDRKGVSFRTVRALAERDLSGIFIPAEPLPDYENYLRCYRDFREEWDRRPELFRNLREGMLSSIAQLLIVAKRIVSWLEENYYPVIFARATGEARKDISNFVSKELGGFGPGYSVPFLSDLEKKKVILRNQFSFALEERPFPADIVGNSVEVLVPNGDLTGRTEWSVYIGTLFGLLSQNLIRDGGLKARGLQEPEELVANFLTCKFAQEKMKSKVHLKGEGEARKVLVLSALESETGESFTAILREMARIFPEVMYAQALVSEVALQQIRKALLSQDLNPFPEEDWLGEFHRLAGGIQILRDHLWKAGFESVKK